MKMRPIIAQITMDTTAIVDRRHFPWQQPQQTPNHNMNIMPADSRALHAEKTLATISFPATQKSRSLAPKSVASKS